MERTVAAALRSQSVSDKALNNLMRHLPDRQNGFEVWRLLFQGYRPRHGHQQMIGRNNNRAMSTLRRLVLALVGFVEPD